MFGAPYPPVDFLAIGHICYDLVPGGRVAGGAAAYGASAAQVLGCRSGVVTSAAAGDTWQETFPDLVVHQIIAPATTVFENVYTAGGRQQTIHAVAGRLTREHVPAAWTRAPMIHIGPVAGEVDPAIIRLFSDSVVGVGPQGWMRRWDEDGRIYQVDWERAVEVLPLAAVTVLSTEDLADAAMLEQYRQLSPLLVVTEGARGCTVYCRAEERHFPAHAVEAVEETGAGDIFAAAYLVRFYQTDGNPWDAADFANRVAACSVTRRGLPAKMDAIRHLLVETLHQPADH